MSRKGYLSDEAVLLRCPEYQSLTFNKQLGAMTTNGKSYLPQQARYMYENLGINKQVKENMIEEFIMKSQKANPIDLNFIGQDEFIPNPVAPVAPVSTPPSSPSSTGSGSGSSGSASGSSGFASGSSSSASGSSGSASGSSSSAGIRNSLGGVVGTSIIPANAQTDPQLLVDIAQSSSANPLAGYVPPNASLTGSPTGTRASNSNFAPNQPANFTPTNLRQQGLAALQRATGNGNGNGNERYKATPPTSPRPPNLPRSSIGQRLAQMMPTMPRISSAPRIEPAPSSQPMTDPVRQPVRQSSPLSGYNISP